MNRANTIRNCVLVAVSVGLALIAVPRTAASSHEDRKAVQTISALVEDYARSVSLADTRLAAEIWEDSPDASFIHPLGHEHGWAAIKSNIYEKLMGETFSERKLVPKDVVVHAYGDAAWAEFYWDFTAKFRKDGAPVTTHGRETQVYRRTGGRGGSCTFTIQGCPLPKGHRDSDGRARYARKNSSQGLDLGELHRRGSNVTAS